MSFHLHDEIHFPCNSVYASVRRYYVEAEADSYNNNNKQRRQKRQRCIEANTLVEVIDGNVDLDDSVLIEVRETAQEMEIPVNFLKVNTCGRVGYRQFEFEKYDKS